MYEKENLYPYQLELWQWFFNMDVQLNKPFKNPRRNDKRAGCKLKMMGSGFITFFDPSDIDLHNKNIFGAIMSAHGCDFHNACIIATKALGEGFVNKIPISPIRNHKSSSFNIFVKTRKWNSSDKGFWSCATTTKTLIKEKCFPITEYWIPNKQGEFYKTNVKKQQPVYVNYINGKKKLYGPANRLFLTTFGVSEIGGLKPFKNKEFLIITMNLKSYLCLIKLGYNCRYVPSESSLLPLSFIEWIKDFEFVYFLMDNDMAGIIYGNKLDKQWNKEVGNNCKPIFFETDGTYIDYFGNEKPLSDPYDLMYGLGEEELKYQLNKLL